MCSCVSHVAPEPASTSSRQAERGQAVNLASSPAPKLLKIPCLLIRAWGTRAVSELANGPDALALFRAAARLLFCPQRLSSCLERPPA